MSGAIAAEDIISDNASDELFSIRRSIRKCESTVRDGLARYTSGSYSKYLQEGLVTVRNGRFVIPVKAEHKGEIKGIVHDTSSSGGTLFSTSTTASVSYTGVKSTRLIVSCPNCQHRRPLSEETCC